LSDFRVAHGTALQNLMEQVLGILFAERLVGLERVTQDGTKIRAQASKRSFLDRKHLQQCLDLAKRHVAKVDADNGDQLVQRQEAARDRLQTKLRSALQALSIIEQAKKQNETKPAQVSISDPDARFMRQGDGAIAPSYNVQFTTDTAQGLVVGVAVSQASNDAKELPLAMDRFQEQYGSYPAQVVDAQADQMICPENKRLRFQYFDHQPGRTIRVYIGRKEECHVCPSRQACCGQSELKQTGRKITVSEDQVPIRTFDARMNTAHAKRIYRQRARVAEFPHAWIKSKCGLRQFRCRTTSKVACEALFAALTYNFQRYMKLSSFINR